MTTSALRRTPPFAAPRLVAATIATVWVGALPYAARDAVAASRGVPAAVLVAEGRVPAAAAAQEAVPAEQEPAAGPMEAPPGLQPILRQIAAAPSAERLEETLRTLVGFGTRHTLSDTVSDTRGIGAARRWVHAEFERISAACGGCLEVSYLSDTVSGRRVPDPTPVVSVMAVQRGRTDPGRLILLSGHLDSRVSASLDAASDAPGANDDASGVSAVIEAARVLSERRFDASIVYVAFSGEEQGLYGSEHLARLASREGWNIEAVLNNDIVGNIHGQNGAVDNTLVRVFSEGTRADETEEMERIRRFTGGELDSPSRNVARHVHRIAERYMPHLDVMMIYRLDRFGRGGDHRSFNAVGYPAVRITEPYEDYRRQHQDIRVESGVEYGDVPEEVEFGYLAKVTGLNAAAAASLAWAPPPPTGVEIEGAVSPSTTLRWDPIPPERAPDLAGYKIYWRLTTSPTWERSVYVGDVTEHTLENVVIDNFFFGVASVSEDGFESPVVFPGPVGAFAPAPAPAEVDAAGD